MNVIIYVVVALRNVCTRLCVLTGGFVNRPSVVQQRRFYRERRRATRMNPRVRTEDCGCCCGPIGDVDTRMITLHWYTEVLRLCYNRLGYLKFTFFGFGSKSMFIVWILCIQIIFNTCRLKANGQNQFF